jgi:hypothetical protein
LAVIGLNLPLAPFIMRPQSRPFVVEIKRSKKTPAPVADQAEAPRPKVGLFDNLPKSGESASAARQAAEKLFGAVAKPVEPAPAVIRERALAASEPAPAQARKVWFAPDPVVAAPELEPAFHEPAAEKPARERRPRGRPKAIPADLAGPSMLVTPVPPVVQPLSLDDEEELVAADVLVADQPRRSGARLGHRRKDDLPRGERWKRRLPSVCR